jgi:serine protease Do
MLACSGVVSAEDSVSLLRQLDAGFSGVFEKVAPTVVVIEATRDDSEDLDPAARPFDFLFRDEEHGPDRPKGKNWSLPDSPTQSEGSGFIIRADGYILTNRHVIAGAAQVEVRAYDGRRWTAHPVASDEKTDIAVLKVEATGLPVAVWGDSDRLRIGQLVCAIGAPFNQDYSFTCGWVSGKGRNNLLAPASPKTIFEDYIQTDAFINPGNSGGPLFDVEGRVIGMNTLINGLGRGLAFAIPSGILRDVSDQLIDGGRVRRAWLGVRVESLDAKKNLREQFPGISQGALIYTVEAGGPAAESDLRPGDVVTAIDGSPLRSAHDLVREIQRRKVGQKVDLGIWRASRQLTLSVATREQPDDLGKAPVPRPALLPQPGLFEPGLKLGPSELPGAVVLEILPESPAAKAELKAGDLINAVGGEPMADAAAVMKAIRQAVTDNPQKGALVQFLRDGKKSWAVIERPPK